jgi:hypothetical protein
MNPFPTRRNRRHAGLHFPPAWAEKADRDKPVNIEADRVSVDDVKKLQVFEGNVQLVKGTLIIRAERIVVSQDDDGYQRGVATGTAGSAAALPAEARRGRTTTSKARRAHRARCQGRKDRVLQCAPGSRADSTKFAASSFPTMR